MYVKKYGTGNDVIVALHGWGGDHRTVEPLEKFRPASYRIVSIDLPGYGSSPAPSSWTMESVAEEIAETLAAENISRCTLLGNCSGAVTGMYLAQLLPSSIERCIFVDMFAYVPWYFKIFLLGAFGRRAYRITFATSAGRSMTNGALRTKRTAHTDLTASFKEIDHDVVYRYLQMMDRVGNIGRFNELRMPITLVYGEKTFGAVKDSVALWKAVWPHAESVQLAGAGHLPIEEATEQLARIVFLRKEDRP